MDALWREGFSDRSRGEASSARSNAAPSDAAAAPDGEAQPSQRDVIMPLEAIQTLAVHLHRQATLRSERHVRLQAALNEELAKNAAVQAESNALREEIAALQARLSGEVEGGEEMRAMKTLIEEQEKYEALEQQVTTVNEKLEAVRSAVNQLVLKKQEPSADEIIDQDASAALSGLGSIEQLTTASAEAAA